MSSSTIVRGTKTVGIVVAGVLLAASVGSATAAPATSGAPASVTNEAAPVAAVDSVVAAGAAAAQPSSWRESAPTSASALSRPSRKAAARQALAAKQAQFTAFTTTSKDTKDMRGIEPSLYRGKYFNKTSEAKRLCVVERESEGFYDVVNPSGAYRGAYQVSSALARGATWMMLKEHKKLMGEKNAKRVLAQLRSKPMNAWPRYWQDAAFHTVINYKHTLSGAAHWAGGRWHC